ncbi:MAG TPA: TetR/AcrR family transcriptional regulator [Rhizorhapis sp.]|nr:TetR/AcrR family transcriptional regulator [Rhizorhapis sp.]
MNGKKTQERGRLRRGELVSAARKLLHIRELDEISLTDMADAAGIPKSSAYHLFGSAFEVHAAAAQEIAADLLEHLATFRHGEYDGWPSLVEQFIRYGALFFKERPDASQLLLGPKSPPAIKLADRQESDVAVGLHLIKLMSGCYRLPAWPSREETFFRAIEISDLFFSLSVLQHGKIVEELEIEAARATNAYLSLYLPPILPAAE